MSFNTNSNANSPIVYGVAFKSYTTLPLNTAEQVFSPASNTNGAIVWDYSSMAVGSGLPVDCLIAKTGTSPTSIVDGDVLSASTAIAVTTTNAYSVMKIPRPIFIPAGKGLYYIAANAVNSVGQRSCLYTLL